MKTIFATVNVKSIESLSLTANRWVDSYGNTYHSCYLSGLVQREISNAGFSHVNDIESTWVDLAQETFTYGYDRQYDQTALDLFKECVTGINFEDKDFISYLSSVCKGLNISLSVNVHDVKRKKDL